MCVVTLGERQHIAYRCHKRTAAQHYRKMMNLRGGEVTRPLLRRYNQALSGSAHERSCNFSLGAAVRGRKLAVQATRKSLTCGQGTAGGKQPTLAQIRQHAASGSNNDTARTTSRPQTPACAPSINFTSRPATSPARPMSQRPETVGGDFSLPRNSRQQLQRPKTSQTEWERLPATKSQVITWHTSLNDMCRSRLLNIVCCTRHRRHQCRASRKGI